MPGVVVVPVLSVVVGTVLQASLALSDLICARISRFSALVGFARRATFRSRMA